MNPSTLPIHPYTGLQALSVLPSGRVVWPVLGGNGEGGQGGEGGGTGGGTGGQGGAGGAGGGQGGGDGGQGGQPQTFSQADVDRIVGERLGREKSKYGDYDDLKAKATELDKLKESQASDAEKAVTAAVKETETKVRGELEPKMTRLEVAIAKGLPEELGKKVLSAAKRLAGTTREELEADAAEFFASSPITVGNGGSGPNLDQGTRGKGGGDKPTVASGADLYAQRRGKQKTTTTT